MDEDDEDNAQEDGKDEVDVYDPAGFDVDAPKPAHAETPLDSNLQSPSQRNGITPVPAQAPSSPAGVSSSALPSGSGALPDPVETSAPATVGAQAQFSPPRSTVNGSLSAAASKSRLAHDTIGILEDRIKDDPRGDPDAYLELINEYKSRNKQDEVSATYDRYLTVFPLDVSILGLSIRSPAD